MNLMQISQLLELVKSLWRLQEGDSDKIIFNLVVFNNLALLKSSQRSHSRKFRIFSAHWCRHTSSNLNGMPDIDQEGDTTEIDERPETAEQFCQKLNERQKPPVIIQPSRFSNFSNFVQKLKRLCCWCCCIVFWRNTIPKIPIHKWNLWAQVLS